VPVLRHVHANGHVPPARLQTHAEGQAALGPGPRLYGGDGQEVRSSPRLSARLDLPWEEGVGSEMGHGTGDRENKRGKPDNGCKKDFYAKHFPGSDQAN